MRLTPESIVLTVSGGSSLEEEQTVNSPGYLSFSLSREKTVDSSSVLEFCGVSLTRDERLVLKDVSWKVKSGEHWAVIGNSGSGKTSMLMMAAGYLWPTSGRVSVLGSRL
ncbi:ATP-binding cassette domain-containing protein, partial [Candidatus Bathyarchaeota archaeon]|nr:ATP-binding cassette domain-containing protein [Candidatus Bathyarchaeota archaeon]